MSPFDFDEDVKIPYPKDFLGMLKEKAPRTAMTLAATDLNSNFLNAANVATIQAWATGNP